MKLSSLFDRIALAPALFLALGAPSNVVAAIGGGSVYVDAVNGDDANDGSAASPWKTITNAITEIDGAGGVSIHIAAGTYDSVNGESFPLEPDSASLIGPGDGTAIITGDENGSVIYITQQPAFSQSIEGLTVEYSSRAAGGSEYLIHGYVRGALVVDNCELSGGYSALRANLYDGAAVTVTNNTITGATYDGLKVAGYSKTDISVVITGNTISGTGDDGIDCYFTVEDDSSTMSGTILISDNTISGCSGEGIEIDLSISDSDSMTLDMEVTISNNTISDVSEDGCELDCSIDSSEDNLFVVSLLFEENTITNTGDDGLWFGFYMESDTNVAEIDLVARNNTITGVTDDGMDVSLSVSDSSSSLTATILLEGNTVASSGDNGVEIYCYMDYGSYASLNASMTIRNNTIEGSGAQGLSLSMEASATGSSSQVDIDVIVDENTITGNVDFGIFVTFNSGWNASSAYNSYNMAFNNNTLTGNNTVLTRAQGVSTSIGQVYLLAPAGLMAIVDGTHNWWGTQDQGTIADEVVDGVEFGSIFSVLDHTSARPTTMEFDVTIIGSEFTLDTTGLTKFISYAGSDVIVITVDGTVVPETDYVAFGAHSITGTLPTGITGTVDFCVTNPAGQTGCEQGFIDGGVNTAPPVAIYDSVTTDNGTSVTIDLVANDTDVDGNLDPTTVVIVQQPGQGSVVNNGDGTVTYTPNATTASDTFNYQVSDTGGLTSNTATVQVYTSGGGSNNNTIPTAVYDHVTMNGAASITIDVLANDWDADGDALDASSLVIRRQPRNGTATVVGGQIEFTPDAGSLSGNSVFTYRVRDEHGALSNTATIAVWH